MKLRSLHVLTLAISSLTFIFLLAGGALGYQSYQNIKTTTANLAHELIAQDSQIKQAQTEIAALLAANETVANQLKDEATKRAAAEEATKTAQAKLNALAQTVEQAQSQTASAIVKEWRPRIAAVRCTWTISGGTTTKLATAVLMPDFTQANPQLLTSEHVVTNADKLPDSCELTFPEHDEAIPFKKENITLSSTRYDWAKITLPEAPSFVRALSVTAAQRCEGDPATGDAVVVLGYPKIGDKDDITATEGIISGTDNKYYITSAKVERGNSGGAAILVKRNCYLGIPTFVDAGEIESLARILQHQEIGRE